MDPTCTEAYATMRQLLNAARDVAQRNAPAVISIGVITDLRKIANTAKDYRVDVRSDGRVFVTPTAPQDYWYTAIKASHASWMWFECRVPAVRRGRLPVRQVIWPVDGSRPLCGFFRHSPGTEIPDPAELRNSPAFATCTAVVPGCDAVAVGYCCVDTVSRQSAGVGLKPQRFVSQAARNNKQWFTKWQMLQRISGSLVGAPGVVCFIQSTGCSLPLMETLTTLRALD